jgi:hypothetical protein
MDSLLRNWNLFYRPIALNDFFFPWIFLLHRSLRCDIPVVLVKSQNYTAEAWSPNTTICNRPVLKSGARAPPKEYYAWFSQELLCINYCTRLVVGVRFVHIYCFFITVARLWLSLLFTITSTASGTARNLINHYIRLNLYTRMAVKQCLRNPVLGLSFRPPPWLCIAVIHLFSAEKLQSCIVQKGSKWRYGRYPS